MEYKTGNPANRDTECQLTKAVETYLLDGSNTSGIPLPHDCVIKSIREEDDYLIIDFEDDISYHDAIKAVHPDALTLTMRFHLEDAAEVYGGLQGIYQYRRSKIHGEGYMRIKNLGKLQKLIRKCGISATCLYLYTAYQQVIVELYVKGPTLLKLWTDYVEFEWTLKGRSI